MKKMFLIIVMVTSLFLNVKGQDRIYRTSIEHLYSDYSEYDIFRGKSSSTDVTIAWHEALADALYDFCMKYSEPNAAEINLSNPNGVEIKCDIGIVDIDIQDDGTFNVLFRITKGTKYTCRLVSSNMAMKSFEHDTRELRYIISLEYAEKVLWHYFHDFNQERRGNTLSESLKIESSVAYER